MMVKLYSKLKYLIINVIYNICLTDVSYWMLDKKLIFVISNIQNPISVTKSIYNKNILNNR